MFQMTIRFTVLIFFYLYVFLDATKLWKNLIWFLKIVWLNCVSASTSKNLKNPWEEFVKFDGLDGLIMIENNLLVFEDSCDKINKDIEFVELLMAGSHKRLDFIYDKLFRWSKTIELNIYHIILFKSPRDLQQLDHHGRQLNATKRLQKIMNWLLLLDFDHRIKQRWHPLQMKKLSNLQQMRQLSQTQLRA